MLDECKDGKMHNYISMIKLAHKAKYLPSKADEENKSLAGDVKSLGAGAYSSLRLTAPLYQTSLPSCIAARPASSVYLRMSFALCTYS